MEKRKSLHEKSAMIVPYTEVFRGEQKCDKKSRMTFREPFPVSGKLGKRQRKTKDEV